MGKQKQVCPHDGMILNNKKEKLPAHMVTCVHFRIITLSETRRTQEKAASKILVTRNSQCKTDS